MKEQSMLRQLQYKSTTNTLATAENKTAHITGGHLPLVKVSIDFEEGKLFLKGDWQYIVAANKHNANSWYMYHREQVTINATIFEARPINLNHAENDGLMFPLEGSIKDGSCIGNCSGLLVVDNVRNRNGQLGKQWNVTFYLYDTLYNNCEITFKLPVYQDDGKYFFN